ncbi:L-seryl-tRNA(Sec) selenium transferase, partial [bacterium]|nr:L-seryl-tRNA(Sec) selenium transferase [bacterium]
AVLLALNALCSGKEVIVSRGQLIEIGGSFRLPDVMKKSGAIMREVGTTNKTRLKDYQQAITENTGALFVAHTSNYRVLGFTEEAELAELASMAHAQGFPLIHDLGGGVLLDLQRYRLPYEPLVQDSLAAGTDVVTFSGDKVLGGPQAGLIVGKRTYIEQIHQNPIMRAVRCDKLVFAAMEATLRLYFNPETVAEENRTLFMISEPVEQVQKRAQTLLHALGGAAQRLWSADAKGTFGQIGSGALPLEKISSWAVVLTPPARKAGKLAQLLRECTPGIVGYVQDDRVFLDMRTVSDEEAQSMAGVINQLAESLTQR